MDGTRFDGLREKVYKDSILVSKDIIVELYSGFERVMKLVGGLLYRTSMKAGRSLARSVKEEGLVDKEDCVEAILETLVISGYATKAEINRIEMEGNEVKTLEIKLEGSLLGSRLKGKGSTVDSTIAGFVAGWLEEFFGTKYRAKEVKCIARGDPFCLIEVRRE